MEFEPVTFYTSSICNKGETASKFREFLKVDLRRSEKTAYEPTYYFKRFLKTSKVPFESATSENVRKYLKSLKVRNTQYKNILMALKLLIRDFLRKPEVVASFRFLHQMAKPDSQQRTSQAIL